MKLKKRSKRIRRGMKDVSNPLYLNANIVFGECLNFHKKPSWKEKIKTQGTILKLKNEGYDLVTSILTRHEVIHRLHNEKSISLKKARELYQNVLRLQGIFEITNVDSHVKINPAFVENVLSCKVDLKDAMHLSIARSLEMPLCTHDKKMRKDYPQHDLKKKFYEQVFKPQELIKKK